PTCASSRSCSAMRVSPRRSSTPTSRASGSGTSMVGPIHGPERGRQLGMSYTDRLMSSGERIVHQDRQHWFVVLANGRYGVFAILGALLLVIVQAVVQPDPGVSNVLGAAAAI